MHGVGVPRVHRGCSRTLTGSRTALCLSAVPAFLTEPKPILPLVIALALLLVLDRPVSASRPIAGAVAHPPRVFAAEISEEDRPALIAQAWHRFRAFPGVVGVSIRPKERAGRQLAEEGLTIKVERKHHPEVEDRRIPGRVVFHDRAADHVLATDVVEVGRPTLDHGNGVTVRPAYPDLAPGEPIAAARARDRFGTFGCLVRDAASGEPLLLGSDHVMRGDPQNEAIVRVRTSQVAGTYLRGVRSHRVDAAVARPSIALDPHIPALGCPTGTDTVRLADCDHRMADFHGAGSGHVRMCMIRGVGDTMTFTGDETLVLHDLIALERRSGPGDSGSLLVDRAGRALGMIVGSDERFSYAMRIDAVLRALRVTLEREGPE